MKASVIIATYGRESCLVETIRSVFQQNYPDFELLIVDQTANHTPEVESFLKNLSDPRYSYFLVSPPSLPAARNFGLSRARGDIIIYIDDDVFLEPDFILNHVHAYQRSSNIAGIGGRTYYLPNRKFSTQLPQIMKDASWKGGFDWTEPGEAIAAVGCNMSFRRSALNEIGGFDCSFEGNALREESDVSFRLRRRGYQIWFEPKASLEHRPAATGGCREKDLRDTTTYYQNETIFLIKNLGVRSFCTAFFLIFTSYILPYKRTLKFWHRLKAFSIGITRGLWFLLFPKKLHPRLIRQWNRLNDIQVAEKVLR